MAGGSQCCSKREEIAKLIVFTEAVEFQEYFQFGLLDFFQF